MAPERTEFYLGPAEYETGAGVLLQRQEGLDSLNDVCSASKESGGLAMPEFVYSGNRIIRTKLSAKEKAAMAEEAKKIVAEEFLEHEKEELAVVAWRLHQRLGWGEKRISDFLRDFYTDLKQLNDYYQLGGTDTRWLCSQKLKDSGIDWDKIYTSIQGRV